MIPSRRRPQRECYLRAALKGRIKNWNYLETKELAACSPQRRMGIPADEGGKKRKFEVWWAGGMG
jgi:hypothetical protein